MEDDESNLPFDETSQPMDIDEPVLVINSENKCFCNVPECRELDLSSQLDAVLDLSLIFTSPKQPERLWPLLAHGHGDPETYINKLNEYRKESHCGLAWPSDYVAYRCKTCSVALTMAICTECFRNGNHEGHNYNMFKSRSGGACDCGFSIMESKGHCANHGRNSRAPRANEPVPESLTCIPQRSMPRMLGRLAMQLRRLAVAQTNETEIYLDTLTQIANSSAVLRNIMIQAILSEDSYSSHLSIMNNHRDARIAKASSESLKVLKQERKKLLAFKIPSRWPVPKRTIAAFCDKRRHKTFLEEFVFWMVVYEFHQKLVCFLLSFLMDDEYKAVLAKLFVNYYPSIARCLARLSTHPRYHNTSEHLSRRILQVSVQIYNDGSQADDIGTLLQPNPLCQHRDCGPKVINCDNPILRERQMASFSEDLPAIFNFDHEAKRLLNDKDLLDVWLGMLSYFQTMSPYKRELYEHTPYETGPRISVFMIESEFCLVPLWTILGHLKDEQSIMYTRQLLKSLHAVLANWIHAMSIGPHSKLDAYHMSFHIPLHRMLAATIRHMIYEQGAPEEQVYKLLCENQQVLGSKFSYRSAHGSKVTIKIDDFLRMLLLHPLQALTLYHQTRSGMWTRNGLLTVNQAILYVHCSFCYSIVDMDMFLLKYCAFRMKPDAFLKPFLQRFYAWHCLSFTCGPIFSDMPNDTLRTHYYFNIQPEQITQLVESCLVTLIELLTLANHCNITEREQTRRELIAMISVADRSYSYLADMLPTISEPNRDDEMFESLLEELTDYKPASHGAGGNLQQGCYTLKSSVWEDEYDPIHVLYRYYQRRDYQQSLERFFQHAKLNGKLNRRHHSSALWPPLKVPSKIANFGPIDLSPLIGCQTLLGVVFSIIYKCIHVEEMPDSMMAYIIYLLELSIRKYMEEIEVKHADHVDLMDHDAGSHEPTGEMSREPAKNVNFAGRFCYRELISYYESMPRGEAMLKGRTIYSLFIDDQPGARPDLEPIHANPKFFPFVKHALDLAFDTTWFPFESVLDNCLVHIETVHSLPRDEFDAMVQCASSEKNDITAESAYEESIYATASASSDQTPEQHQPDMSTSSSTRSTESQTGTWSNLIGIEMEEVDDDIIIVDEDDFGDLDDDIDVIEQGHETIDISDSDSEDESSSLEPDGTGDQVADVSELDLTLLDRSSTNETSPLDSSPASRQSAVSSAAPAILDIPSRLTGHDSNLEWTSRGSSFRVGANAGGRASEQVATSASASSNSHTTTTISNNNNNNNNNNNDNDRSGAHREAELVRWEDCMAAAVAHVRQQQHQRTSNGSTPAVSQNVATHERAQPAPHASPDTGNNPAETSSHERTSGRADFELEQSSRQQLHEQEQSIQAQNLITERRAILDSEPRPMITNPPQPLALEAASSAVSTASVSASATVCGPGMAGTSAAASNVPTNQELSQQRYSSAASGGVDGRLVSGGGTGGGTGGGEGGSGSPSMFIRSGDIVPRSILFGELDNLADRRPQGTQAQPQPQNVSNQPERSLSEVDIQARFMGFFQSDAVSRVNSSRIYRIRQTARRGNYRGAYLTEPYLAHAATNNQDNTTTENNNNNNNSFGGTGTVMASTTNNNTASTNNNNNNPPGDGAVEELVRRTVAVVPVITDAVRATARATISLAVGDEQNRRRLVTQRRDARREILADSILNSPGVTERGGTVRGSPRRDPGVPHWRSGSASTAVGGAEQAATSAVHRRQVARRGGPYRMQTRFLSTRHSYQPPPPPQHQQQQQQQQSYNQQAHHLLQDLRNSRRLRKEYRQHHGESILTLLLRLHAKYSQQPRSYQFDEQRARTNLTSRGKCRIGDGAHFVTIALDLICASDVQRMLPRVELLTDLIWPKPASEKATGGVLSGAAASTSSGNEKSSRVDVKGARGEKRFDRGAGGESDDTEIDIKTMSGTGATAANVQNEPSAARATGTKSPPGLTSGFGLNLSGGAKADPNDGGGGGASQTGGASSSPLASLTPEERRRRARERQNRLMAEFANKQRAFMEFAAGTSGLSTAGGGIACTDARNASVPSTSPRAHSQTSGSNCSSPRKYSNLTLQSNDKTGALGGHSGGVQFNDEQPINLSSKSSQGEQAAHGSTQAASRASGTTDNNGGQLSDDSSRARPHQTTSRDAHDKRVGYADGASSRQQQQHHQRPPEPIEFSDDCGMTGQARPPPSPPLAQQPQYECCICGVEGSSDSTNPLGQVVLLQSTSVVGHSHLGPRHERRLPCEESDHEALKLETYAKYLERRIDLLCDHFTESSWLDSINIGAEGGVHVQSCGHYLHIECHQSYIRSLDQEDRLRARADTDEFQCPVCRQLANSVLPILDDNFFCDAHHRQQRRRRRHHDHYHGHHQWLQEPRSSSSGSGVGCNILLGPDQPSLPSSPPSSSSLSAFALPASTPAIQTGSETLDDQIAQLGLRLRHRHAPSQRELQSSAAFCSHLTKATGPQYRLVRTQASMHSLFLFLASIARTNLEAGLIVQSIRRRAAAERQETSSTGAVDSASGGSNVPKRQSSSQVDGDQELPQWPRKSGSRACRQTLDAVADNDAQKRTCYQLLFHVLALNAQTLINDQWFTYDQIWCHLTHCVDETNRLGLRPKGNEVPLLLRDPIAMLLQFLFTVSGVPRARAAHMRTNFTCLVKILFNLTVIQSVALVLSYVKSELGEPLPDSAFACGSASASANAFDMNRPQPCQSGLQGLGGSGQDRTEEHSGEESRDSSCKMNKQQRQAPLTRAGNQADHSPAQAVGDLLSDVWTSLSPLLAPSSEQPLMNSVVRSRWPRLFGQNERNALGDGKRRQQQQQENVVEHEKQEHNHERGAFTERAGSAERVRLIENKVKLACLPFLRAAAFLQEHLYSRPSPLLIWDLDENYLDAQASAVDQDFARLVECLELARGSSSSPPTTPAVDVNQSTLGASDGTAGQQPEPTISLGHVLNWPSAMGASGRSLIASWASELLHFALEFSIAARSLLVCRPLGWHRPSLMQLPHAFDDIFMFYYRRKCSLCQQVPKDVAVCLVCGAPICLRNSCCKDRSRSRQVHSQHCGANTAVFLAVHTSAIVVIRGNRACVWGSVYLDAHDEEDNGLQRGKPLYLVPARFALLETQWLTHSFDHTCGKRWIYLQDNQ